MLADFRGMASVVTPVPRSQVASCPGGARLCRGGLAGGVVLAGGVPIGRGPHGVSRRGCCPRGRWGRFRGRWYRSRAAVARVRRGALCRRARGLRARLCGRSRVSALRVPVLGSAFGEFAFVKRMFGAAGPRETGMRQLPVRVWRRTIAGRSWCGVGFRKVEPGRFRPAAAVVQTTEHVLLPAVRLRQTGSVECAVGTGVVLRQGSAFRSGCCTAR